MTAILELGGAIGARKGFDAPILPVIYFLSS